MQEDNLYFKNPVHEESLKRLANKFYCLDPKSILFQMTHGDHPNQ